MDKLVVLKRSNLFCELINVQLGYTNYERGNLNVF